MKHKALVACATVFFSGACIMIVELAAGRIVSRYLGQSLYTWTSVIGVILAGISIGNFLGGRWADRPGAPERKVARLFLLAAAVCLLTPPLNNGIAQWLLLWKLSWPARIFWHILLVFLPASLVLGTISPVVARWLLAGCEARLGASIGALYAWNTAGSILGTFAAGYFLIARVGATQIVLLVALVLAVLGVAWAVAARHSAGRTKTSVAFPIMLLLCAAGLTLGWASQPGLRHAGERLGLRETLSADTMYARESQYALVRITAEPDQSNHRAMLIDKLKHSDFDVVNPLNLLYDYTWVYEAVVAARCGGPVAAPASAQPQPKVEKPRLFSTLTLGGGAYAFPRYLEAAYPGSPIDVCEIDPVVTEAAHVAGGLRRDTRMGIHDIDARLYLTDYVRRLERGGPLARYDFIFGDSVSDYSVPYPLTTLEFQRMVAAALADDGVYALNLIDCYEPGLFLGSVLKTCGAVFPHIAVFTCNPSLAERDTFVVVCSKRPFAWNRLPEQIRARHPGYGGYRLDEARQRAVAEQPGAVLLTDNFAPVENLLAPVVRKDKTGWINYHFTRGVRQAEQGRFEPAAAEFRKVTELYPRDAQAWNYLGRALKELGRTHEALDAFAMAVQYNPDYADVRNNAALLLVQMGHMEPALEQWRVALALNPDSVEVHNNMATALAMQGRLDEAIVHWQAVLKLDAGNDTALVNFGSALLERKDPRGALVYFYRALAATQHRDFVEAQIARAQALTSERAQIRSN